MIRAIIKPAKRFWGGRRNWQFEIRAGNGERIDPRDAYQNREDAIDAMELIFSGMSEPVELVIQDRHGNIEERRRLR